MKELTPQALIPVEIVQQQPSSKKVKTIKIHKGHKLYKLDATKGIIEEVAYKNVRTTISGAVKKDLVIEPDMLYESALNVKSAEKKFAKRLGVTIDPNHKPKEL